MRNMHHLPPRLAFSVVRGGGNAQSGFRSARTRHDATTETPKPCIDYTQTSHSCSLVALRLSTPSSLPPRLDGGIGQLNPTAPRANTPSQATRTPPLIKSKTPGSSAGLDAHV